MNIQDNIAIQNIKKQLNLFYILYNLLYKFVNAQPLDLIKKDISFKN